MNTRLFDLILQEAESSKDEAPKEMEKKENIMVSMAEFISDLDDDFLDDKSYDAIETAFDSLLDVIISLEEEDLDDESDEQFIKLMKAFDSLETVDVDEAYKYKPKKVKHGKRRSQKSRMTGAKKREYIKKLKQKRKTYKKSASMRLKAKKKGKKYRRSAKGKQTKRIYKSMKN